MLDASLKIHKILHESEPFRSFLHRTFSFFPLSSLPFYNQMVMLYKFIIPQEEMVNMYHYVHKMGYGAASLFPGYAGVVKEITENKIIKSIQE